MRTAILNLHLYTALIAGSFVVVLGVTGSIMAFEEELDRIFNPGLYRVAAGSQVLPAATLLEGVKQAYPGQRFNGLRLPSSADGTYIAQSRGTQIFINGYTGAIVGTRTGQTALQVIHQLHLRLLMGQTGGNIVCAVAVILVWLVVSGIYLWWPIKRATVKFGASLARVTFDLHNVAGIYSALFLLALALTGIVIHFDDELGKWLNEKTNSKMPVRTVPSVVQVGVPRLTPDAALQAAKEALPGATPISFVSPDGPKGSYTVATRFPEDLTPGGRSWVVVDQYSGRALFVENSRTAVPGTKTIIENRAIHTGDIWGYPTKIVMSLSSLLLVLQAVTGYYMWWKKVRLKTRELDSERAA